jgi:type III secretory pathway component EscU
MGSTNRKIKNHQQVRRVLDVIRMKQLTLPDIAFAVLDYDFQINKFVKTIRLSKGQKYKPGLVFVGVGWGSK